MAICRLMISDLRSALHAPALMESCEVVPKKDAAPRVDIFVIVTGNRQQRAVIPMPTFLAMNDHR